MLMIFSSLGKTKVTVKPEVAAFYKSTYYSVSEYLAYCLRTYSEPTPVSQPTILSLNILLIV